MKQVKMLKRENEVCECGHNKTAHIPVVKKRMSIKTAHIPVVKKRMSIRWYDKCLVGGCSCRKYKVK